jgi:hypothetical protein
MELEGKEHHMAWRSRNEAARGQFGLTIGWTGKYCRLLSERLKPTNWRTLTENNVINMRFKIP